jgi:26S proteasome non-ATPase regulatory subunit 10
LVGADVNIKNNGGRTALHYAASKGRMEIAEKLISHNAKINIKDKVVAWIHLIYL